MTRLTEIAGAGSTAERWDLRSVDLASIAQTAETLRAQFIADQIRRAARAFGRWSGLAALPGSLHRRLQHRRTLTALTQLDDRLLRDIGVSRADIEATATFCCEGDVKEASSSVWQRLGAWLGRERRRRQTVRELSAMSDEILADVGIERAEILAVAAALAADRPVAVAAGEPAELVHGLPAPAQLSASVLAFVEVRRSAQQAANLHIDRPAA